jgi:anti-sigma factor RsiW
MTAHPDMTCRELAELVTEYLEGALDAETRGRFEAHLEMCEGCVAYLEQMRSTMRVLGALPAESLMPPVRERLLEVFRGWGRTRS